jgi:RNA polymerase sigma-70 factor, ECF subfamily
MKIASPERYASHADESLLQLVMQQDTDAFAVLYARYAAYLYLTLWRIVRDKQVAEELLQETFWRVWQRAEQYRGAGTGKAWLYRIARNQALDQRRRQKAAAWPLVATFEKLEGSLRLQQRSAEHAFEQTALEQQVQQALAAIPREQRFCLELAYFEGLSQPEIAQQLNLPLGTIKTRTRIGMKKMARALRGAGYTYSVS